MRKGQSRFIHGLTSLLTGFAFPLGSRCGGRLDELQSEERRCLGSVIVLPGIEGEGPLNHNLARGLAEGGLACSIEIYDWTTGYWPLFAYHLGHASRNAHEATRLAEKVMHYQDAYPGRPTILVGHSGGGALAIKALECLPACRRVTAVYLLAPAISRGYDLSPALGHVDAEMCNFYSPLDCFLLTLGTLLVGTADGKHDVGAGSWGFRLPVEFDAEQRQLYRCRFRQHRYHPDLASFWHFGGHLGWTNRVFVSERLAPLIAQLIKKE